MRIVQGVANFAQAYLFGGECATDTVIAEMVRSLGGDYGDGTIKDIRQVVKHFQG